MDYGSLSFGDAETEADVRTVGELSSVLLQPESVSGAKDEPAYLMYRGLAKNAEDKAAIGKAGLRYDITVVPPRNLGIEYVKTSGHFHPNAGKTGVAYPELYQVLSGRAHYVLQRMRGEAADDVVVIEAREGEIVLIPPGYGHVTINPKGRELRMANWVADGFESDYGPIKEKHGAAYYETVEDNWILNKNYVQPAALRRGKATEPSLFGLKDRQDMYELVGDLSKLDLLVKPQDHLNAFLGMP